MVSSDDSFGWSATSDETMSWSDEDKASQAGFALERKSSKKQLREKSKETEPGSDVSCNDGLDMAPSKYDYSSSENKGKKKMIKTEKTIENPLQQNHKIKNEPEEVYSRKKKKKNKLNALDEDVFRIKSGKNYLSKVQNTECENVVKQEDELSTSSLKKRKKHKSFKDNRDSDLDESLEEVVKQKDGYDSSARKKIKKAIVQEESEELSLASQPNEESSNTTLTPKKRKKHNNQESIARPNMELGNGFHSHVVKTESLSDNNSHSLSKKVVRKRKHKNSVQSDDNNAKYTSNSSQVISPNHKHLNPNPCHRRYSSCSSTADAVHPVGEITSRKVKSFQNINETEFDKNEHDSTSNKAMRVSLPERIQFEEINSDQTEDALGGSVRRKSSSYSRNESELIRNKRDAFGKRLGLSEKIRFEDDVDDLTENDSQESKKSSIKNNSMQKFMEKNPQLKTITRNSAARSIDSDDEVWVIQCPRDCDVAKLVGKDIVVDAKTKIKIDGLAYDGVLELETHRFAVLIPSTDQNKFNIKNVEPKGMIRFRKRIPKVHAMEAASAPAWRDAFIPLPDTKRRHPLFGHSYKKFIKLPANVSSRLSEPLAPRRLKAKRRHRALEHTTTATHHQPHEDLALQDVTIKKKKKKRKLSDSGSAETLPKKSKRDPDGAVWDSEKAIEQSLFNF